MEQTTDHEISGIERADTPIPELPRGLRGMSKENVRELLLERIRDGIEDEKITFYAESLYQPWEAIYKGNKQFPTIEDIRQEPGEWLFVPGTDLSKPFAHRWQRLMTYPWEDPERLWRFCNAIYYLYFAGNQGGKSFWGAAWVVMEALGIHPLQKLTWTELGRMANVKVPSYLTILRNTIRPKPPVHWWAVSTELPAEAQIEGGEDSPLLKTFVEICPKDNFKFYRKDKVAVIRSMDGKENSIVNFKSFDQSKYKFKADRVDGILWDEEPPRDLWREGVPRILKKKGIFLLAMTSDYGSWTWEEAKKKEDPNYFICEMDSFENPFLPEDHRKKLIETLSEDEKMMRRFGKHIQFKGKVFPFEVDKNVGRPFEVTNACAIYVVIDWHPVKPVLVSFLAIDPRNIWYVFDESVRDDKLVPSLAQDIHSKLSLKDYDLQVKLYIIDQLAQIKQVQDGGKVARSIIDMLREWKIYCKIGNPSFDSAHAFLCQKMKNREFWIDPECKTHIYQFDTWGAKRYQKGNLEGTLRDMLEKENNDACMNMVYAYNAGAKWRPRLIEFEGETWSPRPASSRIYGRGVL